MSNIESGSTLMPVERWISRAKLTLASRFTRRQSSWKPRILREGLEPAGVTEVGDPLRADAVDQDASEPAGSRAP